LNFERLGRNTKDKWLTQLTFLWKLLFWSVSLSFFLASCHFVKRQQSVFNYMFKYFFLKSDRIKDQTRKRFYHFKKTINMSPFSTKKIKQIFQRNIKSSNYLNIRWRTHKSFSGLHFKGFQLADSIQTASDDTLLEKDDRQVWKL